MASDDVGSGLALRFAPGATTRPPPLDCALAWRGQVAKEAAVIAARQERQMRFRSVRALAVEEIRRVYVSLGIRRKKSVASVGFLVTAMRGRVMGP
ncbi:MAG: hypothetical protein HKP36_00840 [Myxococcales bacterium]|nr:hypothetical protein [Deltaproteobacteria bacterium]MBT8480106.1 hypothetical protein [Deltaproteobacteria bacterium]NNK42827.1 hypothetical protein [Myxococcales bacterium]NNL22973.1 hypothetical protein [Myxococcales bacterium]